MSYFFNIIISKLVILLWNISNRQKSVQTCIIHWVITKQLPGQIYNIAKTPIATLLPLLSINITTFLISGLKETFPGFYLYSYQFNLYPNHCRRVMKILKSMYIQTHSMHYFVSDSFSSIFYSWDPSCGCMFLWFIPFYKVFQCTNLPFSIHFTFDIPLNQCCCTYLVYIFWGMCPCIFVVICLEMELLGCRK